METLHRTGQVNPDALLTLPDDWQRLHLAHTLNHLTGQYEPAIGDGRQPAKPGDALLAVSRWRQQRANGPTPGDVRAARDAVELGDRVPAAVTRAAMETLRWAGRL